MSERERTAPRRGAVSLLLVAWWSVWSVLGLRGGLFSWHYFVTAARVLAAPGRGGGLQLFVSHPELQFGPVTLAAAWLLVRVLGGGPAVAGAFMVLVGLAAAMALHRLSRVVGAGAGGWDRWIGALLAPAWTVLALHYGHLDDALALALIAWGVLALAQRRWWAAAIFLALATDAKPWALPIGLALVLPIAAVAPGGNRLSRLVRAAGLHLTVLVVPWIPFIVAAPRTLSAGGFRIDVADDSVLALMTNAALTPWWARPLQLAVALVLATVCMWWGRSQTVPLVVVAARIALDPGTYGYYASGLLLCALLADVALGRRPWRALTVGLWWVANMVLNGPMASPGSAATLRLVTMGCLVVSCMVPRRPPPVDARPGCTGLDELPQR